MCCETRTPTMLGFTSSVLPSTDIRRPLVCLVTTILIMSGLTLTPVTDAMMVTNSKTSSYDARTWAAIVAHSFHIIDFKPAWFATNPHFQTIISVLFRKETMYAKEFSILDLATTVTSGGEQGSSTGRMKPFGDFKWDRRQRFMTDDGDFFDADWKHAADGGQRRSLGVDDIEPSPVGEPPLVIICHGLQSSSNSPLAKDMAAAFNNIQMDAVCINFRGCSGECNLTPRAYHVGFTDDLLHLIRTIQVEHPTKRIYLSGFSLGAGVVTKLLADLGDGAPKYNICGAAVNAVYVPASMNVFLLPPLGLADGVLPLQYRQRSVI